jgi:hypothetical protein
LTTTASRAAHNLGTPDNPMTDQQVEDKFVALASSVLRRAARMSSPRRAGICASWTTSAP